MFLTASPCDVAGGGPDPSLLTVLRQNKILSTAHAFRAPIRTNCNKPAWLLTATHNLLHDSWPKKAHTAVRLKRLCMPAIPSLPMPSSP